MRDEWYNQRSRATPRHGRGTETITEGETDEQRANADREIPSSACRAFAIIEIETEANVEKSLNIPLPAYTPLFFGPESFGVFPLPRARSRRISGHLTLLYLDIYLIRP